MGRDDILTPEDSRALIVAHRGAWGDAPQNSLEAFQRAIGLGCDGIEIDVRRTADGRLVVLHDARVRGRLVTALTLAQLRARVRDGQAPLLEEVLELAAGRLIVDVELKQGGYESEVMAIVTRRLTADQYVVTSFDDAILPAVRHSAPEARTGLLLGPRLQRRELERRVRDTGAGFLAPHLSLARESLLHWAQGRGLGCWPWTINDRRLLARLTGDARVEAVITDRPERAPARGAPR